MNRGFIHFQCGATLSHKRGSVSRLSHRIFVAFALFAGGHALAASYGGFWIREEGGIGTLGPLAVGPLILIAVLAAVGAWRRWHRR